MGAEAQLVAFPQRCPQDSSGCRSPLQHGGTWSAGALLALITLTSALREEASGSWKALFDQFVCSVSSQQPPRRSRIKGSVREPAPVAQQGSRRTSTSRGAARLPTARHCWCTHEQAVSGQGLESPVRSPKMAQSMAMAQHWCHQCQGWDTVGAERVGRGSSRLGAGEGGWFLTWVAGSWVGGGIHWPHGKPSAAAKPRQGGHIQRGASVPLPAHLSGCAHAASPRNVPNKPK